MVDGPTIQSTSTHKKSEILVSDPNYTYLITDKADIVLVDIFEIYNIPDSIKPNLT